MGHAVETRWAWELDGAGYTDKLFASHTTQNRSYTGSLIDFGARSLNPTTGRFISADALITDPNNPAAYNRYAFVGNNPLRYTDPDGHCWPICTMLAGAAIGAAVGAGIQVLANAAAGKPLDTDVGKAALIGGVSGAIGGLMPGGSTLVGAPAATEGLLLFSSPLFCFSAQRNREQERPPSTTLPAHENSPRPALLHMDDCNHARLAAAHVKRACARSRVGYTRTHTAKRTGNLGRLHDVVSARCVRWHKDI